MEGIYKKDLLSVFYDSRMEGYWISVGASRYFLDNDVYKDIENTEGAFGKLGKLEAFDIIIFEDLKINKVSPSELEKMFSEVKKIEQQEFEEFTKANNL